MPAIAAQTTEEGVMGNLPTGHPEQRSPAAHRLLARVRSLAATHPLALATAVVAALGLGVGGVAWFEPHKLVVDDRVDEAPPVPASAPADASRSDAATVATADASVPSSLVRAAFRSLEHETRGEAVVIALPDGSRVLRFEGFRTSNGPDLRVYLSAGSDDSLFGRKYGEDFLELGELKGNVGDQNYAIPADVDLSRYRNAVVWCKRFSVGFGVATFG
jgi:electron transfer DM13